MVDNALTGGYWLVRDNSTQDCRQRVFHLVGPLISPPVPARRSAAVPAPRPPRCALRAARTLPALGPPGRPWAAPGGPTARPTRRCGLPSGPSAPESRRVPPGRPRPRPALPRPSVGWSPWAGSGLRSSAPGGLGAALAGRFFRTPAPGAGADAERRWGRFTGWPRTEGRLTADRRQGRQYIRRQRPAAGSPSNTPRGEEGGIHAGASYRLEVENGEKVRGFHFYAFTLFFKPWSYTHT